jgi:hypothetical protein
MSSDAERTPTIGKCKLCLRDDIELQWTHFLPAGVYKIVRDDGSPKPDPFSVTKRGAAQTSNQLRKHLLCECCEQRLHQDGENWVLRHCLRPDGTFKLVQILASSTPSAGDERIKIYVAAQIPQVKVSAIAYFATSVFWRGSIYPWTASGDFPVVLGPYQEGIRQYLMGLAAFPKDCSLSVIVREGKDFDRTAIFPYGHRMEKFYIHKFVIPGFAFTLGIGSMLTGEFRNVCFVRAPGNPILLSSLVEASILRDLGRLMALHGTE